MKKLIGIVLFMVIAIAAQSQNLADSLINVLNTQQLPVKEQLRLYLSISEFYRRTAEPDKLFIYANKGLDIAHKDKNKLSESKFNEMLAMGHIVKGQFDTAMVYLEKALGQAIDANDEKQISILHITFGGLYSDQEKYTLALEHYIESLTMLDKLGDKKMQSLIYANIGGIHNRMGNTERAIYYLEQAKDMAEAEDIYILKAKTYHELGAIYAERDSVGDVEHALELEKKAIEFARAGNRPEFEVGAAQVIAKIYIHNFKDYKAAEEYVDKSIEIADRLGHPIVLKAAYSVASECYREQGRYKESEQAAMKVWAIDSTSLTESTDMALNIAIANIHLGNKEKAELFLHKYNSLKDEYAENNSRKIVTDLEMKYEGEKKAERIVTLEKEKSLYIWLSIAGLFVLLLAIALLLIRHRLNVQKRKMAEQQRELAEKQVLQLEQEKQLIATQSVLDGETAERTRLARDLHDGLGGMLSVVKLNLKDMKNYSILDAPDTERFNKALEMLDGSIGELRRVAHHMMPESLMRNGLKVSLEDFCHAIPNAHFHYFGSDRRLDDRLEVVLYRCAHELVNNALKYADAQNINVQLVIDNNLASLTVQDDGKGFDPSTVQMGSGLENIHTRVSAYNGKMTIHSSPNNGTEISIEIEL